MPKRIHHEEHEEWNSVFKLQHPQPVEYKGVRLDCGYRVDLLVEDKLIIELKSVKQIKGTRPQRHPRGAVADLHETGGSEDRTPDGLQCHQA